MAGVATNEWGPIAKYIARQIMREKPGQSHPIIPVLQPGEGAELGFGAGFGRGLEECKIVHPKRAVPSVAIESRPPSGGCPIKNIYWDPKVDRIAIEYDNKPVP